MPVSILLVEDDEDDFVITKDLLADIESYEPSLEWITGHASGLDRLQKGGIDICLVDYRIGIENGINFIINAKARGFDIPFILVTGAPEHSLDVEASEAGAAGFFDKARLTGESLERAIRYALAQVQQTKLRQIHAEMSRSELETDLREAVTKQQFEAYLQPEIRCDTGTICKAEALIRWNHPRRGLLTPYHFIDHAERSDLIIGIGKLAMEQACQYSNRLNAAGHWIKIAFNVSIRQMERHDFADNVADIVVANRTDPSTIEIEITESAAMREPKLVLSHMETLKRYGITFAVDDFGTGHSGLATLKDFPFDTIKIDRSFVTTIDESTRNRAIAKTIFYLAESMDLETVAEGVETETDFALVRDFGATYAQGYYFAKPMDILAFQQFVHRHNWDNRDSIKAAS
ncbi:MAG: EAL domain-containing protein [Pseudomonadota bacterium]